MEIMKVCEVKLTYTPKIKASKRPQITCSKDAYKVFMEHGFDNETIEHKESFKIMLLNRANRVLGIVNLSEGGITNAVTDIRMIFQSVILANACSFIVAHNHPGGETNPGDNDIATTYRLQEAGKIMDIILHDHIIVTNEDYYSFLDNGML